MVRVARAVLLAFGLFLLLVPPASAQTYPTSTNSWVYDFAGVISDADEAEIARTFQTLDDETGVDAVAVAINSVADYQSGVSIEDFATGLFNHWQLGDAGVDDGVLLVVAVKDRKARVTIGDGFADRYVAEAQSVIDAMLPSFKADNYSGGIVTGAREISTRFRSLGATPAGGLPGSSGDPYGGGSASLPKAYGSYDDEPGSDGGGGIPSGVWYGLGGGGAALFGAGGFVTWQRIKPRKCLKCTREMKRLKGRTAEQALLSGGQNREEELDSVEYDVFQCVSCGAHKVERHGKLFTRYKKCPECAFKTMTASRRTLVAATYTSGGTDRVTQDCQHCDYHHEFDVSTPRKRRTTSSSRSSSSSSRSGPSGGGRSSGRGASGGW